MEFNEQINNLVEFVIVVHRHTAPEELKMCVPIPETLGIKSHVPVITLKECTCESNFFTQVFHDKSIGVGVYFPSG